ncbi:MAG: hypothetical protein M1832_000336 [Thelocarpon impressellum]|nr:MAG: hypothetical protein M1832_000336 [Thelocarpon impressellum]
MSKTVDIADQAQFNALLKSSTIVVTDFHAEWCGPCKQIAPIYEQLSAKLSRPNKITFAKVNVDEARDVAKTYAISAMPTFMIFKKGESVWTARGADPKKLNDAVQKLAAEAGGSGSASGGFETGGSSTSQENWLGAPLPKGYKDVTAEVDLKGVDLLNADGELGDAKTLFENGKPSDSPASGSAKGKGKEEEKPDWVESDTDEQLMLFMPFRSTLKVHSLHITSLPPKAEGEDSSDVPMRPKTVNVYSNRAHVLGFEEAEDIPATQSITLGARDWDEKTGTAVVELRFVKFQNVTSLVVFVVDGDGEGEKVRVDRLRIVGEAGQARALGKLEKIGDEPGE